MTGKTDPSIKEVKALPQAREIRKADSKKPGGYRAFRIKQNV